MNNKKFTIHPQIEVILTQQDIDANDADCIIQIALFGEVVFG